MASFEKNGAKMTVAVLTHDPYLFQKIRHELYDFEVVRTEGITTDLTVVDSDTESSSRSDAITLSRRGECDLSLPFALGSLRALILKRGEDTAILSLIGEERSAKIYGKVVRLTEVEFNLLYTLVSRGGEYATRDQILNEVWGGEADGGVINVYIHYLREKLEFSGERIILSSRKLGYCIDKKYIGGNGYAQDN